jgi:Holliday junction resolvase RusA-like endonuclease
MRIYIYLRNPKRSDIDNYLKPIIDCCVKAGLIKDDRYITYLEVIKKCGREEGFEVEILN